MTIMPTFSGDEPVVHLVRWGRPEGLACGVGWKEARVSFELYLVADPDAHDWEKVRGVLNELRRSSSSQ
jgi:hypothetical protein